MNLSKGTARIRSELQRLEITAQPQLSNLCSSGRQRMQRAWVLIGKHPLCHPLYEAEHVCFVNMQVSVTFHPPCFPVPWSSHLWWLLGELQILLPQMPYPLYSLHVIFCCVNLYCPCCESLWEEKCAELLHLQKLEVYASWKCMVAGAKPSYLYSEMSIYCVFKPPGIHRVFKPRPHWWLKPVWSLVSQVQHWSLFQLKYYTEVF